ncbi:sugar transporter family protein [Aspergillus varians]
MKNEKTSFLSPKLRVIFFATLGSLTYGYCTSIIATTLGQPSFQRYFGLDTASNATDLTGATNGLYQAGGLIGALSTGWLPDKVGRRKAILVGAVFCIIGGILQTASVHIGMFLAARFVSGYGIGSLVTLVPIWQSEVADAETRGFLVGLHGVFILTGYAMASWIGFAFYFLHLNEQEWRIPIAFQLVFPILLASGVMGLVESPRWLLDQGRVDEALSVVQSLYPGDHVDQEFEQMKNQLELDKAHPSTWKSIFTVLSYRRRMIIGFLTMFSAQCTGTQVINNYGPLLYTKMGFGATQQLLINAGWITIGPFGNLLCAWLMDRVGRKKLMVTGMIGCSVALFGELLMIALYEGTTNKSGISAAVFFLFLHLSIYASTLDASTYVYASEIWPTHIRAKGAAISTSGLFVGSLIFLMAAPSAFDKIGWKYYLVLLCATIMSAVIFAIFFPETKGLPLERVGILFGEAVVPPIEESICVSDGDLSKAHVKVKAERDIRGEQEEASY